jgi:hypothetical protein
MSALAVRPSILGALRQALEFVPVGDPAGNLTVGRGTLAAQAVEVALLENRQASGSVGQVEADALMAVLERVARDRSPLVLYIDSAGAKISEGLSALGAFRRLFRAALTARRSGAPIAAILGRNCFGGASMLAHLAGKRLFSPATQLAMSGPSILASSAGFDPFDEMFRAMAEASISAAARAQASTDNSVWEEGADLGPWLEAAIRDGSPGDGREVHARLGLRLADSKRARAPGQFFRRELEKLFPEGYEAQEFEGLVTGSVRRDGRVEPLLGILARTPVGADRAWHFAHAAWDLVDAKTARVNVVLDCESHSASLDDERIVLSEYIVGMSRALDALARSGTEVELAILGRAGGGVYVALAAPATRVLVEYSAKVRVLPGAAVAAILGEDVGGAPPAAESVAAGVADSEIRLGLLVE